MTMYRMCFYVTYIAYSCYYNFFIVVIVYIMTTLIILIDSMDIQHYTLYPSHTINKSRVQHLVMTVMHWLTPESKLC